jgi:hypothetical protein
LPQAGCAGFASHLIYWVKGNKTEAQCNALEGKKVAVICVTGERVEGLGLNNEGEEIAYRVSALLEKNVPKIKMINPKEIADWRDTNNWDEVDYRSIGRGVKAEMVLAIDLSSFSLHDNTTLLRGRSGVKTTVYDMSDNGKVVFKDGPKEFTFPENGRHGVENESNFRRVFLFMLAQDIAKHFYAYDKVDDVAKEAAFLSE